MCIVVFKTFILEQWIMNDMYWKGLFVQTKVQLSGYWYIDNVLFLTDGECVC